MVFLLHSLKFMVGNSWERACYCNQTGMHCAILLPKFQSGGIRSVTVTFNECSSLWYVSQKQLNSTFMKLLKIDERCRRRKCANQSCYRKRGPEMIRMKIDFLHAYGLLDSMTEHFCIFKQNIFTSLQLHSSCFLPTPLNARTFYKIKFLAIFQRVGKK